MKILMTSLGTWDSLERKHKVKHGIIYPLAIVHKLLEDAGFTGQIDVLEGAKPKGPWDVIMISALDSRHFWRVPEMLRQLKIPVWANERSEEHPIVIIGGQACYAPGPILPFADVAYVGEAEVSAVQLVKSLEPERGTRTVRLSRASDLAGCWVPSIHGYEHQIDAVYTDDPSISLQGEGVQSVNLRPILRIEIARGCPHKCPFCVLGWRQPYRPLPAERIICSLERWAKTGRKEVHLQAGDAEAHPDIEQIRAATRRLKLHDHSWTGRLDTVRTHHATPGKQYAFGIEGISERLRQRSGKRGYSNEFIVKRLGELWRFGARKTILHFIGGLPGETDDDMYELEDLFYEIEAEAKASGRRQYLSVGRQPFGPMPHTAWQRKAPGLTHDRVGKIVAPYRGGQYLCVTDSEGQRLLPAIYSTIPMRMGPEVAPVLAKGEPRLHSKIGLRQAKIYMARMGISGSDQLWKEWSKDKPLPWRGVTVRS